MMPNDSSSKQFIPEKDCQIAPIPSTVSVPDDLPEDLDEYQRIPQITKDQIDETRNLAKRTATRARDNSKLDNEAKLGEAQNTYDLAIKKTGSTTTKAKKQISDEIEDAYSDYNKAIKAAMANTKSCSTPNEIPDFIKAEIITSFKKAIAEKNKEYQEVLKIDNNGKLEAAVPWNKAQQEFKDAECKAVMELHLANLTADYDWRKALKDALEKSS